MSGTSTQAVYSVDFAACNETYDVSTSFTGTNNSVESIKSQMIFDAGAGLITSNYASNGYDTITKQWTGADSYITSISGTTTGTTTGRLLIIVNTGRTQQTLNVGDIDAQNANDIALDSRLRAEYCFFKVRYQAYLTAFLNAVRPNDPVNPENAQNYLAILIDLNDKMNAFVKLVDHITKTRTAFIDARNTALNELNTQINEGIAYIQTNADMLTSTNAVLNTRKEMIRYTKEKNNATTNQITLWASLNVVAIAIIFHLYRNL